MTMLLRRAMMHRAAGILPARYRRVEYLESTGHCSMLVPVSLEIGQTFVSDIVYQITTNTNNQWIAGEISPKSGIQFEYGYFGRHWESSGVTTIELLEGTGILAKVHAYSEFVVDQIPTSQWYIFGRRDALSAAASESNNPPCRIWSHSISLNGNKVIDLVPCVRLTDNMPGMYDLENQRFLTKAGSGNIIIPT